jgi:putative peptidoglycan lipid II flippase
VTGAAPGQAAKKSILRTTLVVMPALVVFRAGEIFLPQLLAYWFGRSTAMDVYFFAWAVFAFAGSLVFSAFKDSPLVPVLAEERLARPKEVPALIGSVLLHTWVIGGAVAVAVGSLALGWFALRYRGPELALAAWMVLPFTLYLMVTATRTFFGALLTVERRFVMQPIASGLGMAVNVTILTLGHARMGVGLIPIAALAGEVMVVLILAWYAIRFVGVKLELGFARPPALVRAARLIVHEVGGGALTRVNPVVDQLMAGLSGVVGAGTMLRYSSDVALVPTSLLQAALTGVALSPLRRLRAPRSRDVPAYCREVARHGLGAPRHGRGAARHLSRAGPALRVPARPDGSRGRRPHDSTPALSSCRPRAVRCAAGARAPPRCSEEQPESRAIVFWMRLESLLGRLRRAA